MPERTLSTRALNRALLARQLLLDRVRRTPAAAMERVGGLQTQYAPSGYVGLWSRLEGFARPDLTDALEARRVVQGTLMRVTIHMVSSRDYWRFAAGLRAARRAWWLRAAGREATGLDMPRVAEVLRARLLDGPARAAELTTLLAEEGFPSVAWSGAGLWIDLVRVPPSGTWDHRRADRFALAEEWLGPQDATEAEGLTHLARRYLGGFGPASVADVASWAGLPPASVRPVVEAMDLRRFRAEDGAELLDLPRAPRPEPDTPAPVRFLSTWEAMLLVHARRTQVMPERHRPRVFNTKTPHSVNTFLVDGAVAGSWRFADGRVHPSPFVPLAARDRRAVHEEAERLAPFLR